MEHQSQKYLSATEIIDSDNHTIVDYAASILNDTDADPITKAIKLDIVNAAKVDVCLSSLFNNTTTSGSNKKKPRIINSEPRIKNTTCSV